MLVGPKNFDKSLKDSIHEFCGDEIDITRYRDMCDMIADVNGLVEYLS